MRLVHAFTLYFIFTLHLLYCADKEAMLTQTKQRKTLSYQASAIHRIIAKPILTHKEFCEISKHKEMTQHIIQEQTARLAILQTEQAELKSKLKDAHYLAQCPTCGARMIACASATGSFVYLAAQTQNIWDFLSCIATGFITIPTATCLAGVIMYQDLTEKERTQLADHTVQIKALESALKQYKLEHGVRG